MKAFGFCGRFSEIFKICPPISQKSQFTLRIFSIVWLPRINCQLLLCKAKPAWIIKRSIHYVTLQHYNPGELLKEIPPYLKCDFWYKGSTFETYIIIKIINLGVILQEKECSTHSSVAYADDTQLYVTFDPADRASSVSKIEACICDVKSWAVQNKLVLNDSKTEIIFFSSRFTTSVSPPTFQIGQCTVTPSPAAKKPWSFHGFFPEYEKTYWPYL